MFPFFDMCCVILELIENSSLWRISGWAMWRSSRGPAKPSTLAMSMALARGVDAVGTAIFSKVCCKKSPPVDLRCCYYYTSGSLRRLTLTIQETKAKEPFHLCGSVIASNTFRVGFKNSKQFDPTEC